MNYLVNLLCNLTMKLTGCRQRFSGGSRNFVQLPQKSSTNSCQTVDWIIALV